MLQRSFLRALGLVSVVLLFAASDEAQTAGPVPVINQVIDETALVTLAGNTRPEIRTAQDLGPVADNLHLDMYLQLKRSPAQELAAKQFVESLTDKNSPNFHKWITAAEYGQRFGVASADIATISLWLQSHGFTVNGVPANNMVIDFSGTAAQVTQALHTQIHNLNVGGKTYFANMSDPQIPAALLPAVTGPVSLNNFMPHPMFVPRTTNYNIGNGYQLIVPGDIATIYNLNPAFSGGYTGKGQTIVVVEDTDLYNGTGDWGSFRQTFGLTSYTSASLTQVHPAPGSGGTCTDPGVNGDDAEAAIDVEWATAAAPNAAVLMASCEDTTNFGGFIALQNMLTNGGTLPSIVSISYGEGETVSGASFNSYINTLYQTAAAQGVSVFVSSGDSAAAANDRSNSEAIYGINVSSFASTIYNVAVGGTDFSDIPDGTTSTYWNTANGTYYNSAKSYVPEIPWNDSCGSVVLANYYGFSTTYGTSGLCNVYPYWIDTIGGSGGPSGCATGTPTVTDAVSGTCAGYAKPSWQSIFGNPSDGVRDLPDVALFASNGFWNHYYVVCFSAQASCSGAPSTWAGYGGTSVSSPVMAGIQALINQAVGATYVGNPNPVYYAIGQSEYSTSSGRSTCNSTNGSASTCSFNDITQGDMDIPCAGAFNCYLAGEALGVLSTSNSSYAPAYAAASGWDFATGIGSVNAYNLLKAFVTLDTPTNPTVVSVSPVNSGGSPQTFTATYASNLGAFDLNTMYLLFNTSINGANACFVVYQRAPNMLYLYNNAGNGLVSGTITPGSSGTLSNGQCTIASGGVVTTSGDDLSVPINITFASGFSGTENVYAYATDNEGLNSGWQLEGTWTRTLANPTVVSVSPVNSGGSPQTFTATYASNAGAADLNTMYLLFNTSINGANACFVVYQRATNMLYLYNNAGNGLVTGTITPGSSGMLSNSQCAIASGGVVTASGNNLAVPVNITFAAGFSGTENVYGYATDNENLNSGWQLEGTWVRTLANPTVVSVSPVNSGGSPQTFTATYASNAGAADLNTMYLLFNTSINGANACFVVYQRATNMLYLYNNAGNGLVSGTITPGSPGTLTNSQCTIGNAGAVTLSGTNLAVPVSITFSGSFTGTQNVYGYATDNENLNSGWQLEGTWLP